MLLNLLKIVNKRLIIYALLISLIGTAFLYQKLKIEKLEKQISQIKLKLQQKQNHLNLCRTNIKTLKENNSSKDKLIKQLQNEVKNQKNICQSLLRKKEKLISDLQKLKTAKPTPIEPKIIYKEKCKLKIETGEQLHEKDFIFDTLSNIGK